MSVRIRKVYGKTPKEARLNAQREFGDNISIIRMRPVSPNRLNPDKGTTYELTIAVENEAPTAAPLVPSKGRTASINTLQQAIERVSTVLTASAYNRNNTPPSPTNEQTEHAYSRETPFQDEETAMQTTASLPAETMRQHDDVGQDNRHLLSYIGSELSEIRDVLHILMNSAQPVAADLPDEVLGIHRKFLKHDVESGLARELAEAMLPCFQDEKGISIHAYLAKLVAKLVKTSGGIRFNNGSTVVALVGPTGVGKTTTLAKLAAQYRLRKKKVALITTDDYRIGALEQLETYASILNVPMEVAHEPEELEAQLAKHAESELILIDTPGRSQLDAQRIRLIESFLNAARPTETHLLINMTTRNQDINSVVDRFGSLGIDRLMFTKLDEATCYGAILNVCARTKKPISYLTTGQDVAKDIEVATPSRIATFLLRGFQKRNAG